MTFWVKGLGAEQDYKQYRFSLSIHRSLYSSVVSEVSLLYEFMKEHVLTILDSLDFRWNVLVEDVMCLLDKNKGINPLPQKHYHGTKGITHIQIRG